jgi:hypothetical protein
MQSPTVRSGWVGAGVDTKTRRFWLSTENAATLEEEDGEPEEVAARKRRSTSAGRRTNVCSRPLQVVVAFVFKVAGIFVVVKFVILAA